MTLLPSALLTFTLLSTGISSACAGKILVFPLDGSHWINMKVLIEALHAKGHSVTVLRPSDSWYVEEKSTSYTAITVPSSGGFEENFETYLEPMLELRLQGNPSSLWSLVWMHYNLQRMVNKQFHDIHEGVGQMLDRMLGDEDLMHSLHDAKYDLVLADPGIGGGAMIARRLQIPLVYNVRWTIQGEAHVLIAPSPLSYVPFVATKLTDRMTFPQRIKNVLSYMIGMYTLSCISEPHYKPVVMKHFGPDVDYSTFALDADIWLMRNDFVFEFPRPTMPNIVYMGGFQCKPPKPLPEDLETFVQSSGEHGVIMMTLGTLIAKLPRQISEEIAAAFAQLPQKVIWRYTGERPANLGNNTLLVKWLPQNDLLGHPKTRVFVCHGGTNGVQEAIYHGVPLVGLPLFYDQPDNLFRIKAKGGAVVTEIAALDRHIFGDALRAVLYNSSYRDNMQRLSRLHRDQPMKPLDRAIFWIEYVIRHKGARHLQSHSHKMSWFVYYSVDVFVTLLTAAFIFIFICLSFVRFLWRRLFAVKKAKSE